MSDTRGGNRSVLVTGCSSGIGRATAAHLAQRDWDVYATARRTETIEDLSGCRTLPLDVTDEDSMRAAVDAVEQDHGSVYALVNNAGYGVQGAFETTDPADARKQFETNFFGLAHLIRLVLPAMRRAREGRIVNMSSMGGKLAFPGGSYYHATKHAVEALSDSLRLEVAPFGIRVIVIEPGLIRTRFGDTAVETIGAAADHDAYARFNRELAAQVNGAYRGRMSKLAASPPEAVAKIVARALETGRPRARYRVTAGAKTLITLRRFLPDSAFDALIRSQYKLPRP